MRIVLILFIFCLPLSALAQGVKPSVIVTGDFKELKHTASGRIDKVIDARTILLKDGKIIDLLGIDYPYSSGDDENAVAVAAKARVETLLPEKTEIMLYQTRNQKKGRINRMGHVLAHVVIKETGQWINGTIIGDGFAYAVTDRSNPEMATQLYDIEDKIRTQKKGIWVDISPYGLLTPDTAIKGDGTFRVVQGTVQKSALSGNNLYLNFGADYRKDFTVLLSPALRKTLSRKGIDPMGFAGKEIRVRGWIRQYNGPYMELETPERLEILSPVVTAPAIVAPGPNAPLQRSTGQPNP